MKHAAAPTRSHPRPYVDLLFMVLEVVFRLALRLDHTVHRERMFAMASSSDEAVANSVAI